MSAKQAEFAPGALPMVGHAVPLLRSPHNFLTSLKNVDDVVRLKIGPHEVHLISAPELIQQVFRDDRTYDKGGPIFERAREVIGNGLITCPHAQHRRQRRLVQPVFSMKRLPGYARSMTTQISAVTAAWRENEVMDVLDAMHSITARSLVATMFSDAAHNENLLSCVVEDLDVVLKGLYLRTLMPAKMATLPTPGNKRYNKARTRVREVMGVAIANARPLDSGEDDLLSVLNRPAEDGSGGTDVLSPTEIIDQCVTFTMAGIETTASVLAWALHLIAQHPVVEKSLQAEVDNVLSGPATWDDLPQLQVTRRIIDETVRLYPPTWLLTRKVTRDTNLGGFNIPSGTNIAWSPYVIHRSPGIYREPDRFDPDRWLDSKSGDGRNGEMIPFSSGARKCIGDNFATVEATLALATIAARWQLRHHRSSRVRPTWGVVLWPQGLKMSPVAR
jgi:pentalenene oxygenase